MGKGPRKRNVYFLGIDDVQGGSQTGVELSEKCRRPLGKEKKKTA